MYAILMVLAMAAADTDAVLRLDFGSGPVADGWQSIADTDARWVLPWGGGAKPNGYRDRGAGDALLRDGFSAQVQALALPVPNGDYRVVAHVGDAGYGHDLVCVSVADDADTVTTQKRQFVDVALATTVADGVLRVAFRDGGGADPNVFVVGLEVFCLALAGEPAPPAVCGALGVVRMGPLSIEARCQRAHGHETDPTAEDPSWHEWWPEGSDVQIVWQGSDVPPVATTTQPVARLTAE